MTDHLCQSDTSGVNTNPEALWCSFCECYVPADKEPHRSPTHRDLHYAYFADELEAQRWKEMGYL